MPKDIFVYYVGHPSLKEGLDSFFGELRDRAREKRCRFQLVAGKGAVSDDFDTALQNNPERWNVLLKDSEGPDTGRLSAAICERNKWKRSHAASIFWMVEMMEAWFHADKDALERFYGEGFNRNALKRNPKVEQVSKKDLAKGLRAATKKTAKGEYHKTSHAPKLLAAIDPQRVREAAPNCQRLFESVLARLR